MDKASGEGWGGRASDEMVWYGGEWVSTDETLACCAEVMCPFQSPVPGVVFCRWIRRQCDLPTKKDIGLLGGSAVPGEATDGTRVSGFFYGHGLG